MIPLEGAARGTAAVLCVPLSSWTPHRHQHLDLCQLAVHRGPCLPQKTQPKPCIFCWCNSERLQSTRQLLALWISAVMPTREALLQQGPRLQQHFAGAELTTSSALKRQAAKPFKGRVETPCPLKNNWNLSLWPCLPPMNCFKQKSIAPHGTKRSVQQGFTRSVSQGGPSNLISDT